MSEDIKFKKVTLCYSIDRKEVAKEALKEFYSSKIQILLGPSLIIGGVLLNLCVEKVSRAFGNLAIIMGIIYILLPILILLFNLRKVKNSEVKMVLENDKIVSFDGKNKYDLKYSFLSEVDVDNSNIIIKPIEIGGNKLNNIIFPHNRVTTNNVDEFVDVLRNKIGEVNSKRETIVKNYTENSEDRMRTLFKYTLPPQELFSIMKKEYYSNKKNIYFIVVLTILGVIIVSQKSILGVILLVLAGIYAFQPYLLFSSKIKNKENITLEFDLCKNRRMGILGDNIDKEIPINFIKVIKNEETFAKILIDVRQGGIYYIPKDKKCTLEGDVDEFLGKLDKITKDIKKRKIKF